MDTLELEDDCETWGIPRDYFTKGADLVEQVFEIWPENEKAVELALQLTTQWRTVSGLSGERKTGLDYSAVLATMMMQRISPRLRPALFAQVQAFEHAILTYVKRKAAT